jgi:poly(A) polymerase
MESEGQTLDPEHGPEPRIVPASAILASDVDQDALRVLSRLQRNGFEAYLVGGCVRDLLLGRKPKDFDVATAAHPRQIKRLFRNARIIGRRFRLVHIVYGEHVIETSTFRGDPPGGQNGDEEDLLIVEDNVFGNAEEDARRRDFTINGLFYDPNSGSILDWVDGIADLEQRVVRTIGDPAVRMQEDPVRILRAIKFATRLGFRIDENTWQAMCDSTPELLRCAPPRVFEEILRLLRSGTALGALRMLRACGALQLLLPSIDAHLGKKDDPDPVVHDRADAYWRLLEALDADVHAGASPTPAVCLAVLFLRLVERAAEAAGPSDWGELAERELDSVAGPARLPRKAVDLTKRILSVQRRFTQSVPQGGQPLLFLRSPEFPEALELFRLRSAAWGQGWDVYEGWRERHHRALEVPLSELERERGLGRRRRRRRRPRRRQGAEGAREDADRSLDE